MAADWRKEHEGRRAFLKMMGFGVPAAFVVTGSEKSAEAAKVSPFEGPMDAQEYYELYLAEMVAALRSKGVLGEAATDPGSITRALIEAQARAATATYVAMRPFLKQMY